MNAPAFTYLPQLISLTSQKVYLVGGSVRDLLAGIQDINDIDILMPSGAEDIARKFAERIGGSFFMLDEERRVTRVVKRGDGKTIRFDFSSFEGIDLNADLARRDFTMNAMAIDLREFIDAQSLDKAVDLFHGKEDIEQRLIRAVRPEAFDQDPLRLLRAARFAATRGFTIEGRTAAQIRERALLIAGPAPERVRDELFLILSEPNAGRHLLLVDSLGLLSPLLPELEPLRGFRPGKYHIHDVLTHSLKAAGYVDDILADLPRIAPVHSKNVREHMEEFLEQSVTRKAALRFSCLLHDCAKPETFTDTGGHVRFHGHDNLGADKAMRICRRLRLSRAASTLVANVIKYHMRLFNLSTPGGPSKNAMYRYCRDLGDALPESLILAQADARATYEIMPKEKFTDTEKPMAALLDYYYSRFLKTEEKPLATGQDVIDLGLPPGPRFREILDEVKEKQAEGTIRDRKEALEYLEKILSNP